MLKVFGNVITLLLVLLLLSSCMGLESIRDNNYVVALGIDYDKDREEYIVYTLSLDFANVAKQEGQKPTEVVPSWVGKVRGKTIHYALEELNEMDGFNLFLEHLKTVLLSDEVLKTKMKDITEELTRKSFFRHTINVMGTFEKIEDIFQTHALFFYPQTYTTLLKTVRPVAGYHDIPIVTFLKFLARFYEPVGATYIPSIEINKDSWIHAHNYYPVVELSGAFLFQDQEYVGHKKTQKIKGIRWLRQSQKMYTYLLGEKEAPHTALEIDISKLKVEVVNSGIKPQFNLSIKTNAEIVEIIKEVPTNKIIADAKKVIKEELEETFKEGLELEADLLRLGLTWLRKYPNQYNQYTNRENSTPFYLDEDSIKNIDIEINIRHLNNYKLDIRRDVRETKPLLP